MVLPNELRRWREQAYWTRAQLAEALDLSPSHLWRIEHAQSPLSLELLLRCARLLKVPAVLLVPLLCLPPETMPSNDYVLTPGSRRKKG